MRHGTTLQPRPNKPSTLQTHAIDYRNDSSLLAVERRVKLMAERIEFHQERMNNLADVLDKYLVEEVGGSDTRVEKTFVPLQQHRGKHKRLREQLSRLEKEKDGMHSRAVFAACEAHRQVAMNKYGIGRDLVGARSHTRNRRPPTSTLAAHDTTRYVPPRVLRIAVSLYRWHTGDCTHSQLRFAEEAQVRRHGQTRYDMNTRV